MQTIRENLKSSNDKYLLNLEKELSDDQLLTLKNLFTKHSVQINEFSESNKQKILSLLRIRNSI